ncbi:hypothetical protein HanXRQr2_Chr04g0143131 [Helianthus annuus]|uniref:Uncharacterized protein n=1 Tax=Helianthus annuus TaxID=4232 RepID=A0A9K3NQY2_HELAN|nr:hypothetical protein HanXRQr2_Chr04g0143131 [Helianthus annuus]KAJ0579512.1 hypothetical protein HanHA300_Chr04g0118751 [Helianthus annuus]KAJ0595412.1 hypothetical protein HanHA89_Chr04g0131081 [Helianthus annuus]KAJ0756088.1 hypothetical protein HanLR1_Chr04g0123091 [Helianthus annuus]KAJ0759873.1 hypothetical protein HanOQP8_Chr04g0131451 [Helianthus annuus]
MIFVYFVSSIVSLFHRSNIIGVDDNNTYDVFLSFNMESTAEATSYNSIEMVLANSVSRMRVF